MTNPGVVYTDRNQVQCTNGRKRLVFNPYVGGPIFALTIQLPAHSSLNLTEVIFFKSNTTNDETATAIQQYRVVTATRQ